MARLEDAIGRFVSGQEPAAGYAHRQMGGHRTLCEQDATEDTPTPLLLSGEDGAVYVPEPGSERVADALRAYRFRRTSSTLALRLPADMGGAAIRFALWALPAYLAQRGPEGPLWK